MKWLARFEVNALTAREEHISDSYAWHKRIWEDCFPKEPHAKRDFLTRIDPKEGVFQLWILSQRAPQRPEWCRPDHFNRKKISGSFLSHQYYVFDLRANPVKTIVQRGPNGERLLLPNGKRKSGKRIPIVDQDELRGWLEQKGRVRCRHQKTGADVPGGFRILNNEPLEISPMMESHFRIKEHSAYHGGVEFRGSLKVTDKENFIKTYNAGIGSAKSFGFGLLLLAPISL